MANLVELFENIVQMQNLNGVPLANGKMYVYALGRTRLMDTWSDVDGESLNSNPIILDAAGQCHCYVTDDFDYTIVVTDAYDNEIFSIDKYLYSKGSHSHADVAVAPSETIAVSSYHVGECTVYVPYLTGQLGKVYEGIDPIVVNNTEDKISANHVPLGVQDPLYFVQDDEEGCIIGLSGGTVPEGTMNESAFGYENGQITGYNGSAFSAGNTYEEGSYISIANNTISVSGLTPVPADTASTGLVASVSAAIVSQIPSTAGLASEQWVSQNYQSAIDFGYNSANAISSINDSAIAQTELNVTTELGSFTVNPNTAGVPVEVIYPTDVGKLGIPSALFSGEWENWSGNSGADISQGSYISLIVNTNTPATAGFTFSDGDIIEVNLPMTVSGVSNMNMYYLQSGNISYPVAGPNAVKTGINATNYQFTPGKYIFTAVNNIASYDGYGQVLALVFNRGAALYGPSDISNIGIARNARDINNGLEVNLNRYTLSANRSYFNFSATTAGNLIEPSYSFRDSAERGYGAALNRKLLNSQYYTNYLYEMTGNRRSIGEVVNASSGDRIPYTLKSITGDGNYNTTSATFSRIYNDVNSGIIYEERDFVYSSNQYTAWDPSASYAVRYSGIGSATPQIPVTGINGIKISESGDQVVFEVSGDYYTNDNPSGFITGITYTTGTI